MTREEIKALIAMRDLDIIATEKELAGYILKSAKHLQNMGFEATEENITLRNTEAVGIATLLQMSIARSKSDREVHIKKLEAILTDQAEQIKKLSNTEN